MRNQRGKAAMDFIFMLTRQRRDDRRLSRGLRCDPRGEAAAYRLQGSRGTDFDTLRTLHDRMLKADGKTTYLEVVDRPRELPAFGGSGRKARRRLPDGRHAGRRRSEDFERHETGYYPFPGTPIGIDQARRQLRKIAADTKAMIEAGCAGVDLLAYRATEADPLDLIRAARSATTKPVVVGARSICPNASRRCARPAPISLRSAPRRSMAVSTRATGCSPTSSS